MSISTKDGWLLSEAYPLFDALDESAYIYGNLESYGFQNIFVFSDEHDPLPIKAEIYIDNN